MQLSTHIFLATVAIGLSMIVEGGAENKPSIASEFLSVLAKNVATVLSPTLVGELHDGRPNRTIVNATIVLPIVARTSETPKKRAEATTESTRGGSGLEADTVRSAQTQSEVRPGNNAAGYPFGYDDVNYRYNYPGIGLQGGAGSGGGGGGGGGGGLARPDYPLGSPYANPGYYNADFYRGGYGGAIERGPEAGNAPRVEQVAGVTPVETIGQTGGGRLTDSLDPTGPIFERFPNSERFPPFRNQFSEDGTNFRNAPYRFGGGQSIDPFGSNHQAVGNFPPNFRNSPSANNFARNYFQLGNAFQQRQQQQGGLASNNFDFLSSQRYQNPYDSYPRSLQRGPNFPGFYPNPYAARLRNEARNFGGPSVARNEAKKTEEAASSSEPRAKSEIFKNDNATNSTPGGVVAADGSPEILSVQGRIRFGRLLLPALDDYDDLRFRPDDFREYLFATDSSNGTTVADNRTNNSAANDV